MPLYVPVISLLFGRDVMAVGVLALCSGSVPALRRLDSAAAAAVAGSVWPCGAFDYVAFAPL